MRKYSVLRVQQERIYCYAIKNLVATIGNCVCEKYDYYETIYRHLIYCEITK